MAIAYRYYSAFLAAQVAALDDARATPAVRINDGQNYHPTNKWVLFGHHFAAISGAGPLIGPVLAAQFGYLPGLLWIVIGVCLGGAVQDFLVLAASMRRGGKILAQIAFSDIGTRRGHRRDGRDPVHHRHRAGGAGEGRRQGAGRGGGEVSRRAAGSSCHGPATSARASATTRSPPDDSTTSRRDDG